jgi:hypothetical protein
VKELGGGRHGASGTIKRNRKIVSTLKKLTRMKKCILVSLVLCLTSCFFDQSGPGMSNSIEESKKRGYFICEYQPTKVVINDTLMFHIKEAWLEKQFFYSKSGSTYTVGKYQLIVVTDENIFNGANYAFKWTIGVDFERNFRSCGKNCIMSNLAEIGNDVETWQVQAGSRMDSSAVKKIIGTMTLFKKVSSQQ